MLSLKNSLEKALESGDVENAVKMCSLEAQDLTNKNNTRKTTIKRISLNIVKRINQRNLKKLYFKILKNS